MGEQGAVDVSGGFSSSHIVLYQSVVSIGSRNRGGQRYLSAQDGNCVWRLAVWLVCWASSHKVTYCATRALRLVSCVLN